MNAGDIEQAFRAAYHKRYNKSLREFRRLSDGDYIINGIHFTQRDAERTLETIQRENAVHSKSMISRLITFFGGSKPTS